MLTSIKKEPKLQREEGYFSLTQISSLRLLDFAIDFVHSFAHYNFKGYLLKIAAQTC